MKRILMPIVTALLGFISIANFQPDSLLRLGFVVGPSVVGSVKCTHLAFRGAEVDWQIWIEDGDKPLPRKFILTSKKVTGEPQFTVLIRNWDVAAKLTNQEFSFTPPKGAKKIEFLQLSGEAAKLK